MQTPLGNMVWKSVICASLAHLHFPVLRSLLVGLSKGLVRRCRRPADHDQKHIEDEKRYGNVVEECRLVKIRPKLIGSPEEKGCCKHDRFYYFHVRRPVCSLVDQIGESDHGEWKCGEKVMGFGRKQPGKGVPSE